MLDHFPADVASDRHECVLTRLRLGQFCNAAADRGIETAILRVMAARHAERHDLIGLEGH